MESEYKKSLETPAGTANATKGSRSHSGRTFTGVAIVIIGALLLIDRMGFDFPDWLISIGTLLIVIGGYVGIRQSFKGPVWIILLLIGSVFLVDELEPSLSLDNYFWPLIIISIGLMILFRSKKRQTSPVMAWQDDASSDPTSPQDVIDSVTIFGGDKRRIISKTFRGGEVTTIFGGTEIDLTQADVTRPIDLELTQIFGGTKLIVPPHWRIHSEDMVCIFGGVDDKRPLLPDTNTDPGKILVLRGTCMFGGIDIKSF